MTSITTINDLFLLIEDSDISHSNKDTLRTLFSNLKEFGDRNKNLRFSMGCQKELVTDYFGPLVKMLKKQASDIKLFSDEMGLQQMLNENTATKDRVIADLKEENILLKGRIMGHADALAGINNKLDNILQNTSGESSATKLLDPIIDKINEGFQLMAGSILEISSNNRSPSSPVPPPSTHGADVPGMSAVATVNSTLISSGPPLAPDFPCAITLISKVPTNSYKDNLKLFSDQFVNQDGSQINRMRPWGQDILLDFPSADMKTKFMNEFMKDEILGARFEIRELPALRANFVIENANLDFIDKDEDSNTLIINNLKSLNPILKNCSLKVLFSFKRKNRNSVVLETNSSDVPLLQSIHAVYLGFYSCPFRRFFNIKRCGKCGLIGHTSKRCNARRPCSSCEEHHINGSCSGAYKCINCVRANKRFNTRYDTSHHPLFSGCPCYVREVNRLKDPYKYI